MTAIPATADETREPRTSVCIVTPDYPDFSGGGGIGTAYHGLARVLRQSGIEVTVLHTAAPPSGWPPAHPRDGDAGAADLHLLELEGVPTNRYQGAPEISWRCMRWLEGRRFDVVHFPDARGIAYYTAAAKRCGAAFVDTTLVVGLHGPESWSSDGNGFDITDPDRLRMAEMERVAAERADVVVSPTRYLLDWVVRRGWRVAAHARVHPNVPPGAPAAAADGDEPASAIDEFVFFGRLEPRKGLLLFLDAIERLRGQCDRGFRVTFIGKTQPLPGGRSDSREYALERLAALGVEAAVLGGADTGAAIAYLRGRGRLAVLPSVTDNAPFTVLECCRSGIPFITCGVGGIPEMVDPGEVGFAQPDAASVAAALRDALDGRLPAYRLRHDPDRIAAQWIAWHLDGFPKPAAVAAGDASAIESLEPIRVAAYAPAAAVGARDIESALSRGDARYIVMAADGRRLDDHWCRRMEPVLARLDPDVLVAMARGAGAAPSGYPVPEAALACLAGEDAPPFGAVFFRRDVLATLGRRLPDSATIALADLVTAAVLAEAAVEVFPWTLSGAGRSGAGDRAPHQGEGCAPDIDRVRFFQNLVATELGPLVEVAMGIGLTDRLRRRARRRHD